MKKINREKFLKTIIENLYLCNKKLKFIYYFKQKLNK